MQVTCTQSTNQTGNSGATRVLLAVQRAERARILERTNEGRAAAKANGVQFGRKPTVDRTKLLELKNSGMGATEIASQMGIGRSTVYKLLTPR